MVEGNNLPTIAKLMRGARGEAVDVTASPALTPSGAVPWARADELVATYGKLTETPSAGNGIIRMFDRSCAGALVSARVEPATTMKPTCSPTRG